MIANRSPLKILKLQNNLQLKVPCFYHIIYPSNLADSIRDAGAGHSLILLTTSFLVIILYRVTLKNKIHTQEPKTVC